MTIEQVAESARRAGFRNHDLVIAVAISGAETSGTYDAAATADTRSYTDKVIATNDRGFVWRDPATGDELPAWVDPEYSVGPWQIDLLVHTDISEEDARDYDKAAAYAYVLAQSGSSFRAWSTYTSNAYGGYLPSAMAAVNALPPLAEPPAAGAPQTIGVLPVPQLTTEELAIAFESLSGGVAPEGLPFRAEQGEGWRVDDSTEAHVILIHGRKIPE
jgi:hypothetical protein